MNPLLPRFLLLVICCASFVIPSCSSAPDTPGGLADAVENWIDNPGNVPGALATVGAAPMLGNVSAARMRAEANGRAQMAATLSAKVQGMISNWFKEAGDMADPATVSSYLNDEGLTRQIIDTEIKGARPIKYEVRDKTQYVLVVLEDATKLVNNVGKSLRDRALADATLLKTEVLKRDFSEKMDKIIERDSQRASEILREIPGR